MSRVTCDDGGTGLIHDIGAHFLNQTGLPIFMACVRRLLAILKSYCPIDPTTQRGLKIIRTRQAGRPAAAVCGGGFL